MGRRALMPRAAAECSRAVFAELKLRRTRAGLSQAALAKAMGLSAQSVAKLEAGQTAATLAQFVALCAALDEDPDCILRRVLRQALASPPGRPEVGIPPGTPGAEERGPDVEERQ